MRESQIESVPCERSLTTLSESLKLKELPVKDVGVSIITPPKVTIDVIREGIATGYRNFFLQPGTYDQNVMDALNQSKQQHPELISIQGCVLVELNWSH